MKIKRNIPNFLTCCNLLCGCLALVSAFEGNLDWAAYFVGIAAIFDFFDGFAARLLKVTSPIGKDLDSLADMVTFGVVPGAVIFQILLFATGQNGFRSFEWDSAIIPVWKKIFPFIAFIIPVFSAIRLAKFNNDSRQSESFIGVPTPASAIFFCSIPLIIVHLNNKYAIEPDLVERQQRIIGDPLWALINNYILIGVLVLVFSFLLISELPLFALKFKSFGWKGNEIRYIFLILSLILLVCLKFIGIPLVIILYIILSVINNLFKKPDFPEPKDEGGLSPEGDFKV